jgi:hypothetical protein
MRVRCLTLFLVTLLLPQVLRAAEPKDPLRFVPASAEVVVKLERPRALVEAIENHPIVQEALKIAGVREYYDSTNYRRLQQLIAYFEKELGKERHELLDALTGGGVVFAAKFSKPGAVLLAVQAKDEKLLQQFADRFLQFLEDEFARQDVKEPIRKKMYEGVQAIQVGKAHAVLLDGALLLTNESSALKDVIDWQQGRKKDEAITRSANFTAARKSIPPGAHVWGWVNFEAVRQQPDLKPGFEAAAQDPTAMFLFGGISDVLKRAPALTGYLMQDGVNWHTRVQFHAGREGMGGIRALVVPQDGKGSLPLLQPPRTFASLSYFMDLGELWKDRDKIFNKQQLAELEKGEKESAKFLGSARLGTLLQQAGNHHRVVFAVPETSPYKITPSTRIPAFALVLDMRDPQFAKSLGFILRGAALFGTFASQTGMRMVEKEHAGHTLVSYYFKEDKAFDKDPNGIRFNFSPCFGQVGEHFIVSSTVELGKDLIDSLTKPSRQSASPATMRGEIYSHGVAQTIKAAEDQVLTQLILSQALPPGQARQELQRTLALVERLGSLQLELNYDPQALRFDVRWQVK